MNTTRELNHDVEEMKEQARETAERWHRRALNGTRNAAKTADQYVHENTWTSIAVAAALGCVVGFVLSRARR